MRPAAMCVAAAIVLSSPCAAATSYGAVFGVTSAKDAVAPSDLLETLNLSTRSWNVDHLDRYHPQIVYWQINDPADQELVLESPDILQFSAYQVSNRLMLDDGPDARYYDGPFYFFAGGIERSVAEDLRADLMADSATGGWTFEGWVYVRQVARSTVFYCEFEETCSDLAAFSDSTLLEELKATAARAESVSIISAALGDAEARLSRELSNDAAEPIAQQLAIVKSALSAIRTLESEHRLHEFPMSGVFAFTEPPIKQWHDRNARSFEAETPLLVDRYDTAMGQLQAANSLYMNRMTAASIEDAALVGWSGLWISLVALCLSIIALTVELRARRRP